MAEQKLLKKFPTLMEAELTSSFLQSHGIEVFLRDKHIVGIAAHFAPVVGGVSLFVLDTEHEKANELLTQADQNKFLTPEPAESISQRRWNRDKKSIGASALTITLFSLLLWYFYQVNFD